MQLNNLSSQAEINQLLDEDRYLAIVNSSGWPPTKMLTLTNKAEFLNGLIHQELVSNREAAITSFGRGLELLGMLTMIRQHEGEMKSAFVYSSSRLTADDFCGLVKSKPPITSTKRRQAYQWFLEYIRNRDQDRKLAISMH